MWYQVTLNGNVFSKPNVTFLKISNFFNIYVHGSHREACNYEKKQTIDVVMVRKHPDTEQIPLPAWALDHVVLFMSVTKTAEVSASVDLRPIPDSVFVYSCFFLKVWLLVSVYLGLMYSLRHCLSEVIWICQEECSLWASSCSASALLKPFI